MTVPLLLVIVAFAAGWMAVRWLTTSAQAERNVQRRSLEGIARLSIDEAKERAAAHMSLGGQSGTVVTTAEATAHLDLAPGIREVVEQFPNLELGEAAVGSRFVQPSATVPGMIRVGVVAPGSDVEAELCVRPHDETIAEVFAGEEIDPIFGTYRSVYHWILAMTDAHSK